MLSISDRLPLSPDSTTGAEADARQRRLELLERQLRRLGRAPTAADHRQAEAIADVAFARAPAAARVEDGRAALVAGRAALIGSGLLLLVPIVLLAGWGMGSWNALAAMALAVGACARAGWRHPPVQVHGMALCVVVAVLGFLLAGFAVAVRASSAPLIEVGAIATIAGAFVGVVVAVRAWASAGWAPTARLRHPAELCLMLGFLIALALVVLEAPVEALPW